MRYNTDLPPPPFQSCTIPPRFEYGLVLLATLIRGGGGLQAQDNRRTIYAKIHLAWSSTFATGCFSSFTPQSDFQVSTPQNEDYSNINK